MQAILNINEGEKIFKCMKTDWQVDEDGPIMFRFISKIRKDGQVELVIFSQRQDNSKYIFGTSTFPQNDYLGAVQAIRKAVWGIFPKANMEIEDFADMAPASYTTASMVGFWGRFKIMLGWYVGGMINKIRWFFTRRTPK